MVPCEGVIVQPHESAHYLSTFQNMYHYMTGKQIPSRYAFISTVVDILETIQICLCKYSGTYIGNYSDNGQI